MKSQKRTNKPAPSKRNKINNSNKRKSNMKSSLDPNRLIRQSSFVEAEPYQTKLAFEEMPIHKGIKQNLTKMGFKNPTEIQDKTFDQLVAKKNLIGIADTGTGKTGAFLIPIIQNLLTQKDQVFQSLIVLPTRELALQVHDEFKKLSNGLNLKAACHIGGTNINKDINRAKQFNHLVIGTPGRLLDLKDRGCLKLGKFKVLVLDEFDIMLDMGFVRDIRSIIKSMNNREQTMLFSATKDKKQQNIINEIVKNPFKVEVSSGDTSSKNVDQDIIQVAEGENKYDRLLDLLKKKETEKVILFAETKRMVDRLSKKLNKSGVKSDQIHGNKSQNYRVKALDKFKRNEVQVLVATDVAARGIDVDNVTHVINYQMPKSFDTYIHRIGRTGRAGKKGMAYTFVD